MKTCEKVNGYRNKCTFSFGRDKDGNVCTGFRIGSFEDTLKIDSPKDCPNIAEVSKLVARLATDFVKTSKLELYVLSLSELNHSQYNLHSNTKQVQCDQQERILVSTDDSTLGENERDVDPFDGKKDFSSLYEYIKYALPDAEDTEFYTKADYKEFELHISIGKFINLYFPM